MPKIRRCSPEIPNILWVYLLAWGFSSAVLPTHATADEIHPTGNNAYQTVTGDDNEDDRLRWDRLYNTQSYVFGKEPAAFLKDHLKLLPNNGKVLDIAMGEGRNAVYLARKGYRVEGVDISEVALRKARRLAKENGVGIHTINADLNTYEIKPESYEVILNIDYLQRSLVAQIKKGLKRGGIVVFENYTIEQLKNSKEQIPSAYLLNQGELKELFKDFQILLYRESNDGKEARASMIARKTNRAVD